MHSKVSKSEYSGLKHNPTGKAFSLYKSMLVRKNTCDEIPLLIKLKQLSVCLSHMKVLFQIPLLLKSVILYNKALNTTPSKAFNHSTTQQV